MKRLLAHLGLVMTLGLTLTLTLALAGCGSDAAAGNAPTATPKPAHYTATLHALNASGVTGKVDMVVMGDAMQVALTLTGLTPNQQHMQHIHGGRDSTATCPTSALANADGIITLNAGTAAYGPVALPFEPTPTSDASGDITWTSVVAITPDWAYMLQPETSMTRHVVLIHGLMYKGTYDQTLPVACGPIVAA